MKKIFLLVLLIYNSYCSFDDCENEDYSRCASTSVGIDGYSCFQSIFSYGVGFDEGFDDEKQCLPLPTNQEVQKAFWKINNGFQEEDSSSYGHSEDDEFLIFSGKKDFYNSNEIVEMKVKTLSNDVISKIRGHKTCGYNLIGRNLMSVSSDTYEDISDKNICFNSEKFDDHLNLVDCGHADINFSLNGKPYNIKTCFYMPNDHMPSELNPFSISSL